MSGKRNGAAARISSQDPFAIYIQCTYHCLNLAFVASFKEVSIQNMIGFVKQLSFFLAHPKHLKNLEQAIRNIQTK